MKIVNYWKMGFVLLLVFVFFSSVDFVMAEPTSIPPIDKIESTDRNIEIGVSRLHAGAIVYLKDKRNSYGNIIDYSQGGALFSTAIWTLPPDQNE